MKKKPTKAPSAEPETVSLTIRFTAKDLWVIECLQGMLDKINESRADGPEWSREQLFRSILTHAARDKLFPPSASELVGLMPRPSRAPYIGAGVVYTMSVKDSPTFRGREVSAMIDRCDVDNNVSLVVFAVKYPDALCNDGPRIETTYVSMVPYSPKREDGCWRWPKYT